ncbi:hypothetical protein UT300005_24590 [Clostridium sp. CTA-5]
MQNLPNSIVGKYEEIVEKINKFSKEHLNQEYEDICIKALQDLCLNHEDILKKGKGSSWAAGIVHAIGTINNLFDVKEEPYIKALDLYKEFGVSSSTGSTKSKEVRTLLKMSKENEIWMIHSGKSVDSSTVEKECKVTEKHEADKSKEKLQISEEFLIAQKIMRRAWSEKNYNKKVKYAKEALSICENCSDAYIILSKNNNLSENEQKELLEKAVNAGKNILGIDDLKNASRETFKRREAQPFFGAKYTLAIKLWKMGERDGAIKNAFELLEYNEKDNLMLRGILSSWLLIEKKYDDAEKLFKTYKNDYLAAVVYSNALLLYKTGRIKEAEDMLRKAYKKNSFVIQYIIKQKKLPKVLPNISKFGSEAEAMHYIKYSLEAWTDSVETINWVKGMNINFKIEMSN